MKRLYDERVRRDALRKAALVVGSYQVGDMVSYCREPRAGEHGLQWSVGSRLIVFEKDKKRYWRNTAMHMVGNFQFCTSMCFH